MGFIIAVAIGGILGWIASLLARSDARGGTPRSMILGIIGALMGTFFLGPIFGGGNIFEAKLATETIVIAVIDAVAVLALMTFFRRRRRQRVP